MALVVCVVVLLVLAVKWNVRTHQPVAHDSVTTSTTNTTTTAKETPPETEVCGGLIYSLKSPSLLENLKHGAVAADHPLCSSMGLDILHAGGNAVDAAVTTALCLGVANPASSGMGGGAFLLVHADPSEQLAASNSSDMPLFDDARSPTAHHPARSGKITEVIDGREVAPAAATQDMFAGLSPLASVRGGLGACLV